MSIRNMDFKKIEDEATVKAMEDVRSTFIGIEFVVDNTLVDSREKSLALTKLEEALMWAIKALAVYGAKK